MSTSSSSRGSGYLQVHMETTPEIKSGPKECKQRQGCLRENVGLTEGPSLAFTASMLGCAMLKDPLPPGRGWGASQLVKTEGGAHGWCETLAEQLHFLISCITALFLCSSHSTQPLPGTIHSHSLPPFHSLNPHLPFTTYPKCCIF